MYTMAAAQGVLGKQLYEAPRLDVFYCKSPLSVLEIVSLEGEIQDFVDGEDFKAQFDALAGSTSFSQQRMDGVNYPFIAPYRTNKLTSNWADDWTIVTDENNFTPGRRFSYWNWGNSTISWNGNFKRTPVDETFTTYQNARPTRGY